MINELPLSISLDSSRARGSAQGTSLLTKERFVARARESFAAGEGMIEGVRPEILASWIRCRDQYQVDPTLTSAPGCRGDQGHLFEHDVLFTKLGGIASVAAHDIENDGGIIAITDGGGRVLASWGDRKARERAEQNNLTPWSAWSENTSGTNGMGTALELYGPVSVAGPEHWCEGFHQWACAAVAIRDVVTGTPMATVNVSRYACPLPDDVQSWLKNVALSIESEMRVRAMREGQTMHAQFTKSCARSADPCIALDLGGRVIVANKPAAALLELPQDNAVIDPASRRQPGVPEISKVVRWAASRSLRDPQWRGHAFLSFDSGGTTRPVSFRPAVAGNHLVGMFCEFDCQEGEAYERYGDTDRPPTPQRVVGLRKDRLIILAPSEIRYAEAERNTVWLCTDRGKIQAATRGLDNMEDILRPYGFCRVHRRFLVNLRRVAELERGIKGELVLITDPRVPECVPVSRRHAPEVRRLLGV